MAKKTREQQIRQVNVPTTPLGPELISKRTKRHLADLERSNYGSTQLDVNDDNDPVASSGRRGNARQTISDRRSPALIIPGNSPASGKKKSTMAVRTALLYRKNFASLIEESGISRLPPTTPTYLTAVAPPSRYPPRLICTVCGYWGKYKCKKCGMAYCDMNCEGVHDETRCERRVV